MKKNDEPQMPPAVTNSPHSAGPLPRLMERLTAQTGQVLNIVKAATAAGIEPRSGDNCTRLLEALFLIRRLPAWGRTLRSRTVHSPKLHVVDSGLAAYLLGITPEKLARRDPAALSEFGHLFETFVVAEILKQASWGDDIREIGTGEPVTAEKLTSSPKLSVPRVGVARRPRRSVQIVLVGVSFA